MKSDLRINYSVIGEIKDKINTYKSALDTIQDTLESVNSRLQSENSGEAVAALIGRHENLQEDINSCKEELEDLYELFNGYYYDMQSIISPKDYSSIVQVDKDDIWWNMQSIFGACDAVGLLKHTVSTYGGFSSFSDSAEEKRDQKRNYRKVEEIWDIINSYRSKFQDDKDGMTNLFNGKIAPYEDKDDEYASKAGNVYDKYTSTWERISGGFADVFEGVKNFLEGLIKSVVDLVVGLVTLVVGIVVYAVGGVGVLVSKVTGDTPDCLKNSIDQFDKDNQMIKAILEDPTIIVEGLSQEISDSYEEDGLAYCSGYTAGLIAQMVVLKKVKGGKVAEGTEGTVEAEVGIKTLNYVKLSEELGEKVRSEGYKIIDIEDAVQANKDWADMGYNLPPVAENTRVYNVEAGDFEYARVFKKGVNNPKSPFVLRAEDIKGLSASEIAEKYALPQVPDSVVYPHIPSDTPLEVSIVGPQEKWGTIGGDAQYAIKDALLDDDWFTDIHPLE